jgi:hypothetical protein
VGRESRGGERSFGLPFPSPLRRSRRGTVTAPKEARLRTPQLFFENIFYFKKFKV